MKEVGFESKLIRLVYATLNGSCSRIKVKNDFSNTFVCFEFEKVDEFQYLGVSIRADGDMQEEIKRRIMVANRCFYSMDFKGQYAPTC